MLRAVILSLALLIGLGVVIPLATDYAEARAKKQKKYKKQAKKKGYKKYSKAWWRAYRARKNQGNSIAARKKAMRLKQMRLERLRQIEEDIARNGGKWVVVTTWNGDEWVSRNEWVAITSAEPTVPPPGETMAKKPAKTREKNRKAPKVEASTTQFRVNDSAGAELGSASITVVATASGEDASGGRTKSLSGVSTSALRRTVIDQMIRENGWVVNDYQKQVGGKKVYVVVAQSPGMSGQVQSRLFYFTEVEGRIYSVATNSPVEASGQIADESEKIVNVLQRRSGAVQAGLR